MNFGQIQTVFLSWSSSICNCLVSLLFRFPVFWPSSFLAIPSSHLFFQLYQITYNSHPLCLKHHPFHSSLSWHQVNSFWFFKRQFKYPAFNEAFTESGWLSHDFLYAVLTPSMWLCYKNCHIIWHWLTCMFPLYMINLLNEDQDFVFISLSTNPDKLHDGSLIHVFWKNE